MAQRRWKMMFDRRGDVLRCEFLDGPPLVNGQELLVVEEKDVTPGGQAVRVVPPDDSLPDGDSLTPEPRYLEADEGIAADAAHEDRPKVAV